jgi:hypothetical protein
MGCSHPLTELIPVRLIRHGDGLAVSGYSRVHPEEGSEATLRATIVRGRPLLAPARAGQTQSQKEDREWNLYTGNTYILISPGGEILPYI